MDQANALRDMFDNKAKIRQPVVRTSRVVTITSGKGGVGKTNFAVNLAIYFSQKGKKVVILDADFGLANIEVLFGIVPKYSLADVLMGNKTIEDVLTAGPNGIKFISGGSGLKELANMSEKQMDYLIDNFAVLDQSFDIIIIDTGAGISKTVINFIKAAAESIVITTPEPTSITDAYALVKTIKEEMTEMPEFKIIVNRTDDIAEGREIFTKLHTVSERFLNVNLTYLGSVPYDQQLVKAVKKQQPVLTSFPNSIFARSVMEIGDILLNLPAQKNTNQQGIKSFMKRLINIFGN